MNRPLIVDWKGLKALGWPYSRAHTWRLMAGGWEDAKGEWIAVRRPFPACRKLGDGPNGHPVWEYEKVVEYLRDFGIDLASDDSST